MFHTAEIEKFKNVWKSQVQFPDIVLKKYYTQTSWASGNKHTEQTSTFSWAVNFRQF